MSAAEKPVFHEMAPLAMEGKLGKKKGLDVLSFSPWKIKITADFCFNAEVWENLLFLSAHGAGGMKLYAK